MKLTANNIIKLLNINFNYDVVNTPLGEGVKVNSREAFLFSSITGSGYLDNLIYPFSPKGILKIFHSSLHYKFVTGIFDNSTIRHTPYLLSKSKQYLFSSDKIIIPVEFEKEKELHNLLFNIYGKDGKDENIIVLRVETSKKGYGLESLLEYFVCKYFSKLGYITENQVPLSHSLGSPDFAGFGIKEFLMQLRKYNILPSGFNILELSLLRLFNDKYIQSNDIPSDIIVGEAKTSTNQMIQQIEKYLSSGYFDYAFEIHPNKVNPSKDFVGLFSIKDYNFSFNKPERLEIYKDIKKQNAYQSWLSEYFILYLLSNYTNDELNELFQISFNRVLSTQDDIILLVKKYNVSEHLQILIKFLNHGTF